MVKNRSVIQGAEFLSLLGSDTQLKRAASTNGGEYKGACPFCGGRDRFIVWPDHTVSGKGRFFCRNCDASGDAISYVEKRDGVGYIEACRVLGIQTNQSASAARPVPVPPPDVVPPSANWQRRAREFTEYTRSELFKDLAAIEYLTNERGLTPDTIVKAGLGYNPKTHRDGPGRWGLSIAKYPKGVWIPRGWVIPWYVNDELWRIEIRKLQTDVKSDDLKYYSIPGFTGAKPLYGVDVLSFVRSAIIVEGAFDALTVLQCADDLVTPVATGSTTGARAPRWLAKLAQCPTVLVAFDAESEPGKGDDAAKWWIERLQNAKRWRPLWGDVSAMAADGVDIRSWIAAGKETVPVAPVSPDPGNIEAEAERILQRLNTDGLNSAGIPRAWQAWRDVSLKAGWGDPGAYQLRG